MDVGKPVKTPKFGVELPDFHKKFIGSCGDFVRYKSKPDGSCLANSVALGLYGDEEYSWVLRSLTNSYIVDHWDFYKNYYSLPISENVGVGCTQEVHFSTPYDVYKFCFDKNSPENFIVNITSTDALAAFLQSKESLEMWSTNTVSFIFVCRLILESSFA